ncbi:isomerase/hydrolase [Legionella micdadei]|nr:isomerase/hydrolase [Legionella micdadei]
MRYSSQEIFLRQVYFYNTNHAVTVGNIFCVGRNYGDHIAELKNKRENTPLIFLKPTSALNTEHVIRLPSFSSEIDYETELVLLIGHDSKQIKPEDAFSCIAGYAVGLDLTARDLQAQAKERGLPWALAKGFDYAACVSKFIPAEEVAKPQQLEFAMKLNGEMRQQGHVQQMIFDIPHIINYLSIMFTLQAGDLIFTGTPGGVGRLRQGDQIELQLSDKMIATFSVAN